VWDGSRVFARQKRTQTERNRAGKKKKNLWDGGGGVDGTKAINGSFLDRNSFFKKPFEKTGVVVVRTIKNPKKRLVGFWRAAGGSRDAMRVVGGGVSRDAM